MKKVIRHVDEKRGILQVTLTDERWYLKSQPNEVTGLPEYKAAPSSTWIASYYPKGTEYYRWLADRGWDEAEAIKQEAGDKGSRVHLAIEMILKGEEFRIDTKVLDRTKSTESNTVSSELTFEELLCVQSFINWFNAVKPEVIATERTIFSDIHNFAGTVDFICRIDGVPYVIDFKTSKAIYRAHEIQVSSYRMALENGENPVEELNANGTQTGKMVDLSGLKTAILQVGYTRNKAGYKFTEIEDAFPLFKVAQQIWHREAGSQDIKQYDFPIVLSPARKAVEPVSAEPAFETSGFVAVEEEPIKRAKKTK